MDSISQSYDDIEVGWELQPVFMEVTEELIKDYGELLDDRNTYYNENDDFGGVIGQPALVAILIFRLYNVRYPTLPGGIHAKQEFEFHRPLRPGMSIAISGRIAEKYMKRGRKYVVTETTITDKDGNLIAKGMGHGIVPR